MEEDKDQIIIGSSPSIDASKFVIKLKIPKLENDTIDSSEMSKEAKRVCPECKKGFSSGKALGGHMRIHAQSFNTNPNFLKLSKTKKYKKHNHQQNVDDMIKKVVKKKPYYMSSVNNEGKPTCSQCGKTFPSMKSLFGHMRCHPERIWRGILPPPNTAMIRGNRIEKSKGYLSGSPSSSVSINEEDTNGDHEVVDLTKFLRGWGATERRGRPSLNLDNEEDEDGVLLEAVEDLMSLAQGHPCMTFEGSNSNSLSNIHKGKAQVKTELNDCIESDSGVNTKQQEVVYKSPNKIKKRKKMKLMMDLEPELSPNAVSMKEQEEVMVADECKYKCTTCNKCFTSHQALGGHRSSHNKVKITSLAVDHNHEQQGEYESFEFAGDAMVVMPVSGVSNISNSSAHQCKICDKVFATGQALGGHKRCHWTGIIEPQQVQVQVQAQDPSSQITSTGEDSGSGRKVLNFDLNEIPNSLTEEDEAGNGIAIGYASSSYNSNMVY